jgi:hypothetical protein
MICRKCGKEAQNFSLKAQAEGKAPNLCKECWVDRKNTSAISSANRKAQNVLLSLENQIKNLNEKINLLEASISTIARMETMDCVRAIDFSEIVIPIVEKAVADSEVGKLQKQILKLNNRITNLEE